MRRKKRFLGYFYIWFVAIPYVLNSHIEELFYIIFVSCSGAYNKALGKIGPGLTITNVKMKWICERQYINRSNPNVCKRELN